MLKEYTEYTVMYMLKDNDNRSALVENNQDIATNYSFVGKNGSLGDPT